MLVRTARGDAYSQAVAELARGLHQELISCTGQPPAKESRWAARMPRVPRLAGFWKSSSEG
jgi:pilus assembly protein CpaE